MQLSATVNVNDKLFGSFIEPLLSTLDCVAFEDILYKFASDVSIEYKDSIVKLLIDFGNGLLNAHLFKNGNEIIPRSE